MLFFVGCAAGKAYKAAEESHTISAYESFVKQFPKGKRAEEAQATLAVLYEERDWESATRNDQLSFYRVYLKNHPQGKHKSEARTRIAALEEERDWKKAQQKDLLQGYLEFLEFYPDSRFAAEAEAKIQRIQDDTAWAKARKDGTIESYKEYLREFPKGEYTERAETKIKDRERIVEYWNRTLQLNNRLGYRQFMKMFPDSPEAKLSREALNKLEDEEWEKIYKNAKRPMQLELFLLLYPDGIHAEDAEKRLVDLQVENIFKGSYGNLPAMDRTGTASLSTNFVEIYNNTPYKLTVWYSGQKQSKRIILEAQGKESFQLAIGDYRVAASVSASSVQNYAGAENLVGDYYSVEYFIETKMIWGR